MPRKPRLHYPGALYHVILRGNARQDIFFDDHDRCRFYLLIQEGVERFGHRVLAFCLMTNHVHMAIQVGEVPLSRIMQNLSFRYTGWVNRRRDRSGHLFQGRFKAVLVDADTHLLELAAYLHLNPVRAHIVGRPQDYPWSSHRAFLGNEVIPWLSQDFVLGHFSAQLDQARTLFSNFVTERVCDGRRDELYGAGSIDSRVIGGDRFVEGVLAQTESLPLAKPSIQEVLDAVLRIYDLKAEDLSSAGQQRLPAEARGLAAWAVREWTDATLKDLAEKFKRDTSTMSAAIRRIEIRRKGSRELNEKLGRLKRELKASIFQA